MLVGMDADTMARFFVVVLAILVASTVAAAFVPAWRATVVRRALPISAFVAVGATLGSLWFSERAGFIPCELCWYQRIAMYPLAALFVMGLVRRDRGVLAYGLPIAVVGFGISAYHTWIQWFPETSNLCSFTEPCSGKWVEAFGVFTIPQMAGLSFAVIIATGVMALLADRRAAHADQDGDADPSTVVSETAAPVSPARN